VGTCEAPFKVADIDPVQVAAKFSAVPAQMGELLLAVAVGVVQLVGNGFTTTFTVAVAVQVPDDVIVTV
jgi:hypothetical protein